MQKSRTFFKALGNIKVKDRAGVKADLMSMLGINNEVSYAAHINGKRIHTPAQELAIEAVFTKRGLKVTEIWDN